MLPAHRDMAGNKVFLTLQNYITSPCSISLNPELKKVNDKIPSKLFTDL